MRRAIIPLLFLVALALPSVALAQDYSLQTGSPTFTTALPVELGFVNVANGNLHLEIPLASFPQRGRFGSMYKLVYDSRIWVNGMGWTPLNVPNSWGGWRLVTPASTGRVSSQAHGGHCGSPRTGYHVYTLYTHFSWTAPDGTTHSFPVVTLSDPTGMCGGDVSSGDALADDSSGYHIYVTNHNDGTIYAPDGSLVSAPTGPKDINGNYFTQDINGNMVDTLNRTPVTTSTNGNQITYTISTSTGSSQVIVTTESIPVNTAFGVSGAPEYSGNITVIQSVQLPDGTSYSFNYDSGTAPGNYGELTGINLRTGGSVTYGYTTFFDSYGNPNRWVSSRTPSGAGTWSFTPQVITSCGAGGFGCQQSVTVTKPSGDASVYTFTLNNGAWDSQAQFYTGSASGGTLLETVATSWNFSNPCPYTGCTGAAYVTKQNTTSTVYLPGGTALNRTTQLTFDTNNYGNVTQISDWNYYTGSLPATADRTTTISYLSDPSYIAANILNRATSVTTKDASGATLSQTNISYDSTSLISVTGVTHHDDSFGTVRGNPTLIQRWLTGTTFLNTTLTYDTTGQLRQVTDPNGNSTTYSYADNFYSDANPPQNPPAAYTPSAPTNAYLTQVTPPLIGPATFGYYFSSGKPAIQRDQNAQTAYFHYEDSWDRPTHTYLPIGWSLTNYTSATQLDSYTGITDTSPSTGCSGCRHDRVTLDNLGRVVLGTLVSDPEGATNVATTYDSTGRAATITNPYRTTSDPTYGVSSFNYDGLNRAIQTTKADNSTTNAYYGAAVTGTGAGGIASQLCSSVTYGLGYPSLFVDEAGKKRQIWTGGFGRTIEVDEPDSSNNLTLATCYQYNLLGNLTRVDQKGGTTDSTQWRTRTFAYDSLSRLTSATTPESGTITYTYDNNSNALTRTAPAPNQTGSATVTTTYAYDALNRLTSKSYSDGSTPSAFFAYDGPTNGFGVPVTNVVGRLTEEWTGTSCCATGGAEIFSYDPMGRILLNTQYTSTMSYRPVNYTYDLAGNMLTFTDGVGETYTQTFDGAGRATQLNSNWVDSQHPATLLTVDPSIGYYPHGALRKMTYGNGLTATNVYNNRLQPCLIDVNSSNVTLQTCNDSTPTGNVLDLWMGYNSGSSNNGNIVNWNATGAQSFVRTFSYDAVNRLAAMSAPGDVCSGLSWTYDAWGNRTDQTVTSGACNTSHVGVNAKNQLSGPPYQYDAAGNLTYDGNHSYTYDAENRLIQVDGGSTATYLYDAQGRRVQKTAGSAQTSYIFDLSGQVISEVSPSTWLNVYLRFNGNLFAQYTLGSPRTQFIHTDHLGSTRLVTDMNQSTVDSLDYLPFGEQISGDTSTTHKFTGDERDAETGLDHTWVRQNSPLLGRWLSPDPLSGSPSNPQSLNRYSYVRNSPVNFVDPLGLRDRPLAMPNTYDPFYGGGNCVMDGIDVPCSIVNDTVNLGLAAPCPNNICSGLSTDGQFVRFVAFFGGNSGYYAFAGPHAVYYSLEDALAAAALADKHATLSDPVVREYYSYVTEDTQDGVFSFTSPNPGDPCNVVNGQFVCRTFFSNYPPDTVGLAHDHPNDAGFSGQDETQLATDRMWGSLATMGTSGQVLIYNPVTDTECVLLGPTSWSAPTLCHP